MPDLLTERLSEFQLSDGLLAWVERLADANGVKVNDASGNTSALLTQAGASLFAIGGGAVAYGLNNKLYVWTPETGAKLVLDGLNVNTVKLGSGALFVTVRDLPALYRISF